MMRIETLIMRMMMMRLTDATSRRRGIWKLCITHVGRSGATVWQRRVTRMLRRTICERIAQSNCNATLACCSLPWCLCKGLSFSASAFLFSALCCWLGKFASAACR